MSINTKGKLPLLVEVTFRKFSNTRQDRAFSKKVQSDNSLGSRSGKWDKQLLPKDFLDPITKLEGCVRADHYFLTIPQVTAVGDEENGGSDTKRKGPALLSPACLADYKAMIAKHRAKLSEILEDFLCPGYPLHVEEAKLELGPTYNPADYPPLEEFRSKFSIDYFIAPFPVPESLVNSLMGAELDETRAALVENNKAVLANAEVALVQRILEPLSYMVDRLADPNAIFRDSLVENCIKIAKAVPNLTLSENAELQRQAELALEKLNSIDIEKLRNDKVYRVEKHAEAQQMAGSFAKLGKRSFA